MQYNSYVAAGEFDESARRVHGRVVNSRTCPIVTFKATDVDGSPREFRRSNLFTDKRFHGP